MRDGISLDLFIGDPAFLHRGCGRALLREYLTRVACPHFATETHAYIAHAAANTSALRCSQAAGFRPLRTFLEGEVRTQLLAREMPGPTSTVPSFAGSCVLRSALM